MAELINLMTAIEARLESVQGADGEPMNRVAIVREDSADLETQITKAIDATGMIVLIGEPTVENTMQSRHTGVMKIRSLLAIGENPTLWRRQPDRAVCMDVTMRVIQLLQALPVTGFQPLRVMQAYPVADKKRQLYELQIESEFVVQKTQLA